MPTFEITSPDGKQYEVTGPEGSTKEQALERVKAQHTGGAAEPASGVGDFLKSMPRGLVEGASEGVSAISGMAEGPVMGLARQGARLFGSEDPRLTKTPIQRAVEPVTSAATDRLPAPQGEAGKAGEKVGQVAGNPLSYLGPGGPLLKAGAGALSALGSWGAGALARSAGAGSTGEAVSEAAGGIAGGGAAGLASAETKLSKLAAQLPTRENIKAAATAGYEALKKSDVRISPEGTQDLLFNVKTALHNDQFRDYLAPTTYRAIEELGSSGSATIGDLDGVRRLLGRVPATNPTDRAAADKAIRAIDDFLVNVPDHYVMSGNPANDAAILKHAQGNWALHKQLEQVEDASVTGQHRAGVSGSGANRINTARQEIRKILDSDKKSRGMSDAVKDKMEEIVMGTWATNSARTVGKFAPSGPVSATTSILGGLYDWGVGAAIAGGGFLSKHLGEYLTDRQIKQLEQMMRSESPIGKSVARDIAPQAAEQQAVPMATAARGALTSPLAAGGP